MDIGILTYPARRAEELGFESVWAREHTIIPVTTETEVPEGYDWCWSRAFADAAL